MIHKFAFKVLDQILHNIIQVDKPFESKVFILKMIFIRCYLSYHVLLMLMLFQQV